MTTNSDQRALYHPFLIGERLYLRGLEERDIEGNWFQWFNDKEVTRYLAHGAFPNSRESQLAYYQSICQSEHDLVLAIIDKATETHIGNVSLSHINWIDRNAELGIVIGEKAFWGKGYATEAEGLICDYGFRRFGLHRIWAGQPAGHPAAIRASEKIGFVQEGVLRENEYRDGRWEDTIIVGRLTPYREGAS